MSNRINEQASIHFQLLIFGTVVFLGALYWPALNSVNGTWSDSEVAKVILHSLWLIGGYLGFVVLVGGHAVLERHQEPPKESDSSATMAVPLSDK